MFSKAIIISRYCALQRRSLKYARMPWNMINKIFLWYYLLNLCKWIFKYNKHSLGIICHGDIWYIFRKPCLVIFFFKLCILIPNIWEIISTVYTIKYAFFHLETFFFAPEFFPKFPYFYILFSSAKLGRKETYLRLN